MTSGADCGGAPDVRRICIFARAPLPGVKSRLARQIGSAAALDAHERLVRHTLERLARGPWQRPVALELWIAGPIDHPRVQDWQASFPVELQVQQAGDLGARMFQALERGLPRQATVLLGSDCPGLGVAEIELAFQQLAIADWVFAPAEDGGYALVGCKIADARLFTGMSWGSERVFAQTVRRARALGYRVGELAETWDVDDVSGWQRFLALRPSDRT